MSGKPHILIVGAGMTGLLLAQKLKCHDISFTIFERDLSADHRGAGWGLLIHWALDVFLGLLPQDLREQIPGANVDPEAQSQGKTGRFPFFDVVTGKERFENLSDKRIRLNRKRLRKILLSGLDVQWNKTLLEITQDVNSNITVHFADGSHARGTHLVGCDGAHSRTREILCSKVGTNPMNNRLDARLLGGSVIYSSAMGRRLQELDTYFFSGGDQGASSFFFFAVQDTTNHNERTDQDTYAGQTIITWPYRAGFLGRKDPIEVPTTQEERLSLMKEIAKSWTSPFRDAVYAIPEDTHIQAVNLEYWKPVSGAWDNFGGRATLIGDAAHTMTMFRGEAFNHGIIDVEQYTATHLSVLEGREDISASLDACAAYESEMIGRVQGAVDASNQACLDAHSLNGERITEKSRAVSRGMGATIVNSG